jgi:hypothetical protein
MNPVEFTQLWKGLEKQEETLLTAKSKEYADPALGDVLVNFKQVSASLGISPLHAAGIFLNIGEMT